MSKPNEPTKPAEPTKSAPPATEAPVEVVKAEVKPPAPKKGVVVTYVGSGEDSPAVIKFMGQQEFVRGEAVEVVDPFLMQKIAGNPSFVEGEVTQKELHGRDMEARKDAEMKKVVNGRIQAAFAKKYNKE